MVTFSNGMVKNYPCPVTNMFDIDGDDTPDPFMVCAIVAQLPDGQFIASRIDPEDLIPLQ